MASGRKQYPFDLIEPKWQAIWEQQQTFRAWNPGETLPSGILCDAPQLEGRKASSSELPPKYYVLDMFPYPSGADCTWGIRKATRPRTSWRGIGGRWGSMCCIRWAGMRLGCRRSNMPSRRAASAQDDGGEHRHVQAADKFAGVQLRLEPGGDTTDPKYFKWTQWIFLKLYNSYFDTFLNKAMPIALLEDALSENPQRKREWENNPDLKGRRTAFLAVTSMRVAKQESREFTDSSGATSS